MKRILLVLLFLLSLVGTAFTAQSMTFDCDSSGKPKPYSSTDCSGVIEEGVPCWDTDDEKYYCGTGAAAQEIGSSASMAVGSPVTSGTTGSVLYIDGSGNLAQENASFNYDAATNTFTAEIITTTGSDPKANLANSDDPAALVDGDIWVATGVDAVGISDGTNKYYARPTKLKTCAGNCSPAITELDAMVWVTAAGKVSLPAVATNIYGASACVYSTTTAAVSVDVNASDRIVLNGTALDDGDSILSASAAGNFICLIVDGANGWTTLGRSGVWTDNGIN